VVFLTVDPPVAVLVDSLKARLEIWRLGGRLANAQQATSARSGM